LIEKKNVAEAFTSGHGSPFVARVSLATKLDKGELQLADAQSKTRELFDAGLAKLN